MQRYRHDENSYSSSPPPAAPVEEIHTEQLQEEEEEEYTEEEEEMQPLIQESGGVTEEEVLKEQEAEVQESEGKTAPVESKNGQRPEGERGGAAKYSLFTWLAVLALLGVWSSMAVVYLDIVDYDSVIGKLKAYDSDGDGDFDVEDAKVLLGLTKDGGGANAESLEEILNILAEEGSDWIYGFFTFLHDVVSSPVERGEEEEEEDDEKEAAEERQEEGGATSSDGGEVKGVILDLQNQ